MNIERVRVDQISPAPHDPRLDATEAAALGELGERELWAVDELPPGIDVDLLRCLDEGGFVEARYVVMLPRRRHAADPTPPTPDPSRWVSPIRTPSAAGTWDRILAMRTRDGRHHPSDIRVSERGRVELARLRRTPTQAGPVPKPAQYRDPKEPTRPVSILTASKWFKIERRTFQGAMERGAIATKQMSERVWVFDLGELGSLNPSALQDADPEKYAKPPPKGQAKEGPSLPCSMNRAERSSSVIVHHRA